MRETEPQRKDQKRDRSRAEHAAGETPAAFVCPVTKACGGCDCQGMPYEEQLRRKNRTVRRLLGGLAEHITPIAGADRPLHYRCKVNAAFGCDRKGAPVCGPYAAHSHRIVPVDSCLIEDERADAIIRTILSLLRTFRIRPYNEDTGTGLLRHVQVRRGYATGEYMVTLVCADPVLPSRQNFVAALRKAHPEVSTVVLNVNGRRTSMVLGQRSIVLQGRGWIEDALCGCRFRISPTSFYQVNPPQAERLYRAALELAQLTGRETVLDAYCGTGTIGIIAASRAGQVTGVELNREAVRDAVWNAKRNRVENIRFVCADAGAYMDRLRTPPEVVVLDPPRTGTTPEFIRALTRLRPKRIVYISCGIDSLARDLKLLRRQGWRAEEARPFDLFPFCSDIEVVTCLTYDADRRGFML